MRHEQPPAPWVALAAPDVEVALPEAPAVDVPLPPRLPELVPPDVPPLPEVLPLDAAALLELELPLPPSLPACEAPPSVAPASRESFAPGPSNFHQLKLKRSPLPPVKRKNRSWTPVAPVTGHADVVFHVCAPPVPAIAQVPIVEPVRLSKWSSMLPPLVLDATLAVKDVAPLPKSTLFTLM